jgi:hypothetical protein
VASFGMRGRARCNAKIRTGIHHSKQILPGRPSHWIDQDYERTCSPLRSVVTPMRLTITARLTSGLHRQFMARWENRRCYGRPPAFDSSRTWRRGPVRRDRCPHLRARAADSIRARFGGGLHSAPVPEVAAAGRDPGADDPTLPAALRSGWLGGLDPGKAPGKPRPKHSRLHRIPRRALEAGRTPLPMNKDTP